MKINWLKIKDFRGFRNCEITFPKSSNVVVFIGVNGAGKSAVLDAISILLNVFLLEDNQISDREIYTEGRDSNSILQDAFHVPKYAEEYEKELNEIYRLIDSYDGENAQDMLDKLIEKRGESDLEVMRMQSYIDLL